LAKVSGEADAAFAARVLSLRDADAHTWPPLGLALEPFSSTFERGGDTESPERPLIRLGKKRLQAHSANCWCPLARRKAGPSDIDAIGFANADRDPAKELIVIFAWRQIHYGACGPIYEVRIIRWS
jgi:hypothetical protein